MNIFKNKQTPEYKEKQRHRLRLARIWGYRIGKKYQIGDRINKANVWANAHRRKAAGITLAVNSLIYLIGFGMCFSDSRNDNGITDPMPQLAEIQPIFTKLHRIENMKHVHQQSYLQLGNRIVGLKKDVDSLMALPHKTHTDSVTVLQKYDELQELIK